MTDRIVGLFLLAISIWYGVTAGDYEASFGDPLGPAAFPIMLSVPAAILSLTMIIRPDEEPAWVTGKPLLLQVGAVSLLLAYAGFLEVLGFPLATFIAVALLGRILRSSWPKSIASAAIMSAFLFLAFDKLLGLPLPLLPEFVS
ncbi:tripartite tricarboxylate transporter TctB family protein [Nitratireductor kimnyeongensis]|uniref:Tripartite tricarboxylate transporter TctB family protein n=2 Tax=Nitratireductor TaxID=245876 RepID=A0ABW0TCC7_9HYPH|nr:MULTISPECIES: tripartite tricarboxylate transporter TctB family protein [Nitratireductor]MCC5781252.1 tripartite tricarboxylate transporter TctB family protein [Nitratireductor sp. B36]MEC9245658.1 tripartite tricarboxylate transporter TctB family protein [Pseudomonadota bacterium]QZZ37577.1 tripartite tricarboxylate transporter TctB family protein [Nitratireductor kimnyeongensis]SEC18530.1 putative tricarboxylic transport membrane protein [Nitratireductor aquibiodomus]